MRRTSRAPRLNGLGVVRRRCRAGVQEPEPRGPPARGLYAPSYGQAGAIERWGPARALPRVIGAQNTYWHWSAGRTNTDVLIAVDTSAATLRTLFRDVPVAGRVKCDYCMSWRNDIDILVARGSIAPVESVWARARHYE